MTRLCFSGFELDLAEPMLCRNGREVRVRPQSLAVLVYLARKPGEIVTSEELITNCWERPRETNVNSVAQCIADIRTALGGGKPQIIRTVPRKGYVFAAPVAPVVAKAERVGADPATQGTEFALSDGGGQPPPVHSPALRPYHHVLGLRREGRLVAAVIVLVALATGAVALVRASQRASRPAELTMMAVPTIAVPPFVRLTSGDSEDGTDAALANELAIQLRRVPRGFRIELRSVGSARWNREAGPDKPGVRYLVSGSIRSEGAARRLDVQLVETASGRQLWAEPFTYRSDAANGRRESLALIARLVTERLTAMEAKRPLPARPSADHYAIMGRAVWAGERDRKLTLAAMALFAKGVALDPDSVPALQGFARTKISAVLEHYAPEDQRLAWLQEAEAAVNRVIAQRRHGYGAYRLRGSLYRARGEWDRAAEDLRQALKINSEYAEAWAELGRVKIEQGLASEGLADIEQAVSLSPIVSANLAVWCLWAGQAELLVGNDVKALQWMLRAEQANRASENLLPWLAMAYGLTGRWDKARDLMSEHLRRTPGFSVAAWQRANATSSATLARQRQRLADVLRKLGAPDGPVAAAHSAR